MLLDRTRNKGQTTLVHSIILWFLPSRGLSLSYPLREKKALQ